MATALVAPSPHMTMASPVWFVSIINSVLHHESSLRPAGSTRRPTDERKEKIKQKMPRPLPKPTEAHPAKRQYQPPITRFLAPTAQQSDRSHHRPQHPHDGRPPLDANTQASLLNVGMRIRKAVPEGYKTHKTATSPTEARRPAVNPAAASLPSGGGASSTPRELVPFCGLHRVGGLLVQEEQWPAASARERGGFPPPVAGWPDGSQESNASCGSGGGDGGAMAARLKRDFSQSFCDEDPDGLELPDDDYDDGGLVQFPSRSDVDMEGRAIAVPRRSAARAWSHRAGGWGREQQRSSGDFGEAPFLSTCDDVEVDMY